MTDDVQDEYLAALIELHRGMERQGPGDETLALELLRGLPTLPAKPRIADMGCGSGASTLLLARHFGSRVTAVDFSAMFLEELEQRARAAKLDHLVATVQRDMGALEWPPGSIDLLWSEGAAYILGFENALRAWRPLLADRAIAVVSEMSWFTSAPPAEPRAYWSTAYPTMGTEAENCRRAERAGYEILTTRRLSAAAWWESYYNPLRERLEHVDASPAMRSVARETAAEIELFERFSDAYGYTFYVMRAAAG